MSALLDGPCRSCGGTDRVHPYLDGRLCETCRPLQHPPAGTTAADLAARAGRRIAEPSRAAAAALRRASDDYVQPGRTVTSNDAARRALPRSGTQRRTVLDAIADAAARGHHGATDVELARHLTMSPNSVRPRRGELVELRLVEDSGRRRSHHGADHIVWAPTAVAISALRAAARR